MSQPPPGRAYAQGDVVVGVLAVASLVLPAIPAMVAQAYGVEATYVACWLAVLVILVPLLHIGPTGHGTRALGWLGLAPFVAGFALLTCDASRTSAWHWECGTPFAGFVCLPLFVAPFVVVGSALARLTTAALARRGLSAFAGAILLAIAVAAPLAILWSRNEAPTAEALLASEVTTIAILSETRSLTSPLDIAGSKVERVCSANDDCVLMVDGLDASILDAPRGGPIELAEGLGYHFVRRPGSSPSTWLAYRPGAAYGSQLSARDLGVLVAAPPGLGAAFAFAAAIATLYIALAARRSRTAALLRRFVPARIVAPGVIQVGSAVAGCDPLLPVGDALVRHPPRDVGTYRTLGPALLAVMPGDRRALLAEASIAIGEHLAVASVLLLLGALPLLVAVRCGLAIVW